MRESDLPRSYLVGSRQTNEPSEPPAEVPGRQEHRHTPAEVPGLREHRDTPAEVPNPDAAFAELALRYQQGDSDALAALHERLRPAILAALGRLLRQPLPDQLAADDLQQQTWIILGELAGRWRPTGSFLAYFVRTFERELRRYVARARPVRGRRAIRVTPVPHDELLGMIERRGGGDNGPERAALFRDLLAALTERERVAVVLHVLEERNFGAIGHQLHVSRATAHRLVRRGLARLAATGTTGEP
jgi:RNA polymerase sigma factor (sigma-70 family)